VVFNVTIALMLMELGIFLRMLEHILGLYSTLRCHGHAWWPIW